METGSKKFLEESDYQDDTNLLVHLRLDGASVLSTDVMNNGIKAIHSRSWLATERLSVIIDNLKSFLVDNGIDPKQTASVNVFISSSKFTLIPDILYQQDSGRTYLANTSRINHSDLIFSDFLTHRDAVLIYALDKDFYDELKSLNNNTKIIHNAYALNSLSLKMNTTESDLFLVSVSDSFAELLIIKDRKLAFYNQFPHDVPEDLLYYILFVLEQNRILATEVKLQLISHSNREPSELRKLLDTYIGSVEDLSYRPVVRYSHNYAQAELRKVVHMHSAI